MAQALGWPAITRTIVRRERWLPALERAPQAMPLVHPGDEVVPDQPILHIEHHVEQRSAQDSPEFIPSGLYGRVIKLTGRGGVLIETRAAIVQGILGVGQQVVGVLTMWPHDPSGAPTQQTVLSGAILVVPGPLSFALLRQAERSGVVGIIAASMALHDLEGFLATDLLALLAENDRLGGAPGTSSLTLMLTEGLDSIAMPDYVLNLLRSFQGAVALLSGTTSPRRGLVPELLISLPPREIQQDWQPIFPDSAIVVGARIRVRSGSYMGVIGTVDYLFTNWRVFPSGVRASALRMRLDDGTLLIQPLLLVERIA